MTKARKRQVGQMISATTGRDALGRYWWFEGNYQPSEVHGPFASKTECDADQRTVLLEPECEITFGGGWNPAGDRRQ